MPYIIRNTQVYNSVFWYVMEQIAANTLRERCQDSTNISMLKSTYFDMMKYDVVLTYAKDFH